MFALKSRRIAHCTIGIWAFSAIGILLALGSRADGADGIAKVLREDLVRVSSEASAIKAPGIPSDLLPDRLPPSSASKIDPDRETALVAINNAAQTAFSRKKYEIAAELLRQAAALVPNDDTASLRYTVALWQAGKRSQAQKQVQALASSSTVSVAQVAAEAVRRLDAAAKEQQYADLTVGAAKDINEAKYSDAASQLEQASKLYEAREDALLRLAIVLPAAGDSARAEDLLARLSASKNAMMAAAAAECLKRVKAAVTVAGGSSGSTRSVAANTAAAAKAAAEAEAEGTALVPTGPRPGAWAEWKKLADKQAKVDYRVKIDATGQDSFGKPTTVQFRNASAQRMELELQVAYTQATEFAPGPNDYVVVVRLSPGEESKEKFLGSVQKVDGVKIVSATVLGDTAAADGAKPTTGADANSGSVVGDAVVRKAKLEALRLQLVEDSKRVSAKYRELAAKDSARQAAYQKRVSALTGFAQTLQNSVISNQANSLFYSPRGSGLAGVAYLDQGSTVYGQFNSMMRQFNPVGAEIGAYFDVARAMSAYNLGAQQALDSAETNIQIATGIISLFQKHRDPAEERRQAIARMKSRQKYVEQVKGAYELAQKEADPTADDLVSRVMASDIEGIHAVIDLTPETDRKSILNKRASNGDTPLHAASAAGDLPLIRDLIDKGAQANARDPEGRTPLYRATENGQADAVVVLMSLGGDAKVLPAGDMSYLRALAESIGGKATDAKKIAEIASKRYPEPMPALELAKLRKDKRCVAALEGKYKLAAAPQNAGKVDALVKAGNAPAIARLVEDQNPNMRDELGWTPLHHAAAAGQLEVIATLVDAKASLNAQTRTGRTPLTLAVEKNQPMAVVRLIAAGASVKAADGSGDNAMSLAKKLDRPEIELLLMDSDTKAK